MICMEGASLYVFTVRINTSTGCTIRHSFGVVFSNDPFSVSNVPLIDWAMVYQLALCVWHALELWLVRLACPTLRSSRQR